MKRALLLAVLTLAACDDTIPGMCKSDSDCVAPAYCYMEFCVFEEEGDGGADDAAVDAGPADASESDGGGDAGSLDGSQNSADGGTPDASPVIANFTAEPRSTITRGETATLKWEVSGATSLSIDNSIGSVVGRSLDVAPASTTTYALTATSSSGTVTATAKVTVVDPAAITSFMATPAIITAGRSSTLSWVVTNATSLSIDNGIGSVTGTSVSVQPATTTAYTLTATNVAGTSVTAKTTITVVGTVGITNFTANPATITRGESSMLRWALSGATSVKIDQGIGAITGDSVAVTPSTTTEYELTASNASGDSASAKTSVAVVAKPSISSFSAIPASVSAGQNSTLSWSVTDATSVTIDQGIGQVSGSTLSVSPPSTVTYILRATNSAGYSVTAAAKVTVIPLPAILSFSVNPPAIFSGAGTILSWTVSNASSVTIDHGVGLATGTNTIVTPNVSTTYALTATNSIGTSTSSSASVVVGPGLVSTVAGAAGVKGTADGPGASARFGGLWGIATDSSGNSYVTDEWYNTIRIITPSGSVSTLAGSAGQAGSTDGLGTAARFISPRGIAVDSSGNVFVCDSHNHTIRKIDPFGYVSTIAGLAGQSGSADGGAAARFNFPSGVAADTSHNLYIADSSNHTIRKISPQGLVTTFAGVAGEAGSSDGVGVDARFNVPRGVAIDNMGNVFVADLSNHTIRKITTSGAVTTLAGSPGNPGSSDGIGSSARFREPMNLTVDRAGNIYVADNYDQKIRIVTPAGSVSTLAGTGEIGHTDGIGSSSVFSYPSGLSLEPAGSLLVAEHNFDIRRISH